MKISLNAYAKINLALDVTGKLPNGYHRVDMIMQSVSLFDRLTVETTDNTADLELIIENSDLKTDENNSVILAAKLFISMLKKKPDFGLKIRLYKNIPKASGLAGGSADAAAMLTALNELYKKPFSTEKLFEISKKIGADVAFCLCGGTMRTGGIGDELKPLVSLCDCFFVLIKNEEKSSTKEMYREIDKRPGRKLINISAVEAAIKKGNVLEIAPLCENTFLSVWQNDRISNTISQLKSKGALAETISGSGPTIYGIFKEKAAAEKAYDYFKKLYTDVFLASPVNQGVEIISKC